MTGLERPDEPDDSTLLAGVRNSDPSATAALYDRHHPAALVAARALTGSADSAQELVQESFAAVLSAIAHGAGPVDSFRGYLLATVRNTYYRDARQARRVSPTAEPDVFDSQLGTEDDPADQATTALDARLIVAAFQTLPARWQRVLWSTEIEGLSSQQLGEEFRVSPNTAAALAYRARKALALAFLNAHVEVGVPTRCGPIVPKLASWVRADLTARQSAIVAAHVDDCRSCGAIVAELRDVNRSLRGVAPLLIGLPALAQTGGLAGVAPHLLRSVGVKVGGWWTPGRIVVVAATGIVPAAVAFAVLVADHGGSTSPHAGAPSVSSPIPPAAPIASAAAPAITRSATAEPSAGNTPSPPGLPISGYVSSPGVLPSPSVTFSSAPIPEPLEVTVADRGSAQTLVLADVAGYSQPVLQVYGLPAGWQASMSRVRGAVQCAGVRCTISTASVDIAPSLTINFTPAEQATSGTVVLALMPSADSTGPIASYSVVLDP